VLGRSHLLAGSCGFAAVGALAPEVLGQNALSPSALAAGSVLAAGAALIPDLDTPASTVAHCLGPVSRLLARGVGAVSGGHRAGTHSILATALFGLGVSAGLASSAGRWVVLSLAFLAAALGLNVVADTSAAVGAALAAAVAVVVSVAAGPHPAWVAVACGVGYASHLIADGLTVEGIPLLWPLSKRRQRLPLVGLTGGWRERFIAAPAFGLLTVYLLATFAFIPAWNSVPATANAVMHSAPHPAAVAVRSSRTSALRRRVELAHLRGEVRNLRAQLKSERP
jgi:membrane-bound metal-dependent hydrolase YbcI (DUF457 family)